MDKKSSSPSKNKYSVPAESKTSEIAPPPGFDSSIKPPPGFESNVAPPPGFNEANSNLRNVKRKNDDDDVSPSKKLKGIINLFPLKLSCRILVVELLFY